MKPKTAMERRQFLKGTLGAASLVALAGCDNLTQSSWFPSILNKAEKLTDRVQRTVTPVNALAKEYHESEVSRVFPANGNVDPGTADYAAHVEQNFSAWNIEIVGLVRTPMSWSLRRSRNCRREHRLPGMIVSKVGAPSGNGPASRSVI